ncbi:NAD-dependent epimerase/dehydratase family protein [Viridibacillus sp. YIM B01967]|uniref:NAD-dependent epimerase/dehydratase family protein n=1 Tax=Viridibacillus soli TaxID=2798301 RepID=A0ABS1H514_9BACL|nr:NAD-dependent epimerase/dehydratase family protein [Viridibacillus soli]MBK3494475.1 NAD-dependent epimerase/dehydratase family protein [Viridibacillus soli]
MHILSDREVDSNSKRILITGASGFTGLHACTHFSNIGYSVYGIVRKYSELSQKNVQLLPCDLTNSKYIKRVVETIKPDFVLHLAGQNAVQVSWAEPLKDFEANVVCTTNLIDAIRTGSDNCRTVVVGSILQSNPSDPASFQHPYGLSKTVQTLLSEAYASIFELDVLIAKPSNLIGPGHSTGVCSILAKKVALMEKGQEEKRLFVNNLLAERDFLDVRDVVRAYEFLFSKGETRSVYEITSGKLRSLSEIINLLKGMSTVNFDIDYEIEKQELISTINPIATKALGWAPLIPFEQSMLDILNFQRRN